jgi:hypothetical protein
MEIYSVKKPWMMPNENELNDPTTVQQQTFSKVPEFPAFSTRNLATEQRLLSEQLKLSQPSRSFWSVMLVPVRG